MKESVESIINEMWSASAQLAHYAARIRAAIDKGFIKDSDIAQAEPRCGNCDYYKRDHSHCSFHDSLTNNEYKCAGWRCKNGN